MIYTTKEDTNEFVVVSTMGSIRTYFNPDSGKKYFDRQMKKRPNVRFKPEYLRSFLSLVKTFLVVYKYFYLKYEPKQE